MRTSEKTDLIDAALGRVQKDLALVTRNKGVEVEGQKTKFASKYVTIAELYSACRELLAREQITIHQGGGNEAGVERLYTRLAHGGQWVESSFPIKARDGAQNFGGGVAFARRWALACAVGIVTADDREEKDGYDREPRGARRAQAPSGIAAALAAIRDASDLDEIERQSKLARGAFPTGEASQAVEKEIGAWFVVEFDRCASGEDLAALRSCANAVRPKAVEVRAAIQRAEVRVKGAG